MNHLQIQCFLSAARSLNFTTAAHELHFSPQAVSKYIINFENELGAALFVRAKKKLELTPAGQYCYNFFAKSAYDFRRTADETKIWYDTLSKKFRIGYSDWIDPFGEISKGIKEFRRANSNTSFSGIRGLNQNLIFELAHGNIDVAIISGDQLILGLDFEIVPIAEEDISLVVSEDVCGKDWNGPFDPKCWGVPFIQAIAGDWSYIESNLIISRELSGMGVYLETIELIPNIQSIYSELTINRCATVTDATFGYSKRFQGLRHFPLNLAESSHICCIWHKLNENPLILPFVYHMRNYYGIVGEAAGLQSQSGQYPFD